MNLNFIIYEDFSYTDFYPISLSRPMQDILIGVETIASRFKRIIGPQHSYLYWFRNEFFLNAHFKKSSIFDLSCIEENLSYFFISSRLWITTSIHLDGNSYYQKDGDLLAFKMLGKDFINLLKALNLKELPRFLSLDMQNLILEKYNFSDLKLKDPSIDKINYLYDLIEKNDSAIQEYFQGLRKFDRYLQFFKNRKKNLWISKNVRFYGYYELNTEKGPIIIDDGAEVYHGSYIEGPVYVGKGVKLYGAKIFGATSIFSASKIGCEVQKSIIMPYTNHQHSGYIGNSYIGAFVNFGAASTISNLKSNYGTKNLSLGEKKINSQLIQLGAFVGDHCKFGIGSLIYGGSVFGFGVQLFFELKAYPSFVPSFIWGSYSLFQEYEYVKFLKTIKIVYERRKKVPLTLDEEKVFLKIFEFDKSLRKIFLKNY